MTSVKFAVFSPSEHRVYFEPQHRHVFIYPGRLSVPRISFQVSLSLFASSLGYLTPMDLLTFLLCLQLTVMANPFVPAGGGESNTSDSSTVRLVFRDANGDSIAPGKWFKQLLLVWHVLQLTYLTVVYLVSLWCLYENKKLACVKPNSSEPTAIASQNTNLIITFGWCFVAVKNSRVPNHLYIPTTDGPKLEPIRDKAGFESLSAIRKVGSFQHLRCCQISNCRSMIDCLLWKFSDCRLLFRKVCLLAYE